MTVLELITDLLLYHDMNATVVLDIEGKKKGWEADCTSIEEMFDSVVLHGLKKETYR